MIRRIVAAAGVALLFTAGPAAAQYNPTPSITVVDPAVVPGESITVNGACFQPGATVALLLDGVELATGIADSDSNVSITAVVPLSTSVGDHEVTLEGPDCVNGTTQVLSAVITVGSDTTAPTTTVAPLPVTGSDATTPLAAAGAVLVGGGGLLLLASRKRGAAEEA